MKIPAEWLQEYLIGKVTVKEIAQALESAGIEVEQIISSKKLDEHIVVAEVKKVVQHPNADRLKLAEVDSGEGVTKLVCGAPNLRQGQKVALARPGTVLPDGTEIKISNIRGESSNGMLCSAAELGLSDDHSGILVLEANLALGTKLCDIVNNDQIVDIKTQANRPDLQSMIGLAREVSALGDVELKLPFETSWGGKGPQIEVVNEVPQKASRYLAGDLVVTPELISPAWMKQRLVAAGVRPINIIVDVTNYVMLEYGQPLHAFDATKVKLPITVRMAIKDEKITTLDGVERGLTTEDLVVADTIGPIALAGVMGGKRASVTESTKRIILESATFDGPTIRKTAQRQGLRSESSARFERRLPVQLAPLALNRAAALLVEHAGAKWSGGVTDQLEVWPWVQHIGVRPSRLSAQFGAKLSGKTIVESLSKLGFEAEEFNIAAEARKHLGKPYIWGAKFKTHGVAAFDCSYFADYIYSLIGMAIGHTASQQFELGRPIHTGELKPGDLVFRDGPWVKLKKDERKGVSHNAIYIGSGKIVDVRDYVRDKNEWRKLSEKESVIVEAPLSDMTEDPHYLGARRFAEDLDDVVSVTVPWWRPDVKIEEDILEEVARIVGYDSLPATLPPWRPTTELQADKRWPRLWQTKAALRGLGLFEVMTYSFVSGKQLDEFGYERSQHLKLSNPMSVEQEYLRSDLLASLVGAIARNAHYGREYGLFEISRVFKSKDASKLPNEPTHLGMAVRRRQEGYSVIKGALDLLARELHVEFEVRPVEIENFYPGRSAEVRIKSQMIGIIGELHPDKLRQAKVSGSLGYLELDFDQLLANAGQPKYQLLSKFPSITRDLSLELEDVVTWAMVKQVVDETGLARVEFLSDYYGSELPAGKKGLAIRLEISSMERTLTDAEGDQLTGRVLKALQKALGAKLRA